MASAFNFRRDAFLVFMAEPGSGFGMDLAPFGRVGPKLIELFIVGLALFLAERTILFDRFNFKRFSIHTGSEI